jgi:pimeloyl-ACP methyl ester carboxylesterase
VARTLTSPASTREEHITSASVNGMPALAAADLLGHSAGASIAFQYAAAQPERVRPMLLIAPGARSAGLEATPAQRRALMQSWAAEPWYAARGRRVRADPGGRRHGRGLRRHRPVQLRPLGSRRSGRLRGW